MQQQVPSPPYLEEPRMQQQGVGRLRIVFVADVQVLELVQVPGSEYSQGLALSVVPLWGGARAGPQGRLG